ncbi:glycolate oxidase subunit GlcD [Fictibacillus macauensis ZFHKF-1]|uniref:D-lactate dehydrogenase (cytochrome) n=1 Tax=Fictibacillus macauensis ZFHKF-1 TaxID=1196324 RepID=I8J1Y3_9BACL|nr:FAD-linked oxidase C-terminal domain-containing protein [Fictibacillus macauensis]EIT85756.1 glycolate oxidase subunit GlcD [Fictibacillus macauensis ZFHKF-1]
MKQTCEYLLTKMKNLTSEKRATTNEAILRQHSMDESHHTPSLPDVVVFPETTEEISSILAFANQENIPVVPFGAGSSLEGHSIPLHGGITLSFQRMNAILEVRPDDFLVTLQPGVTTSQLNNALKKYGLFFPVDPGADATLGGMAATNASGTTSVKYGIMRSQVLNLQVVLADGNIIQTGGLAAKSSAGYHLSSLFVGSEGTLGIFSELTLKVYGISETIIAGRAVFPSVKAATQGAIALLGSTPSLARVELVDPASIAQVNLHSETNYPEQPTLFLEFHGNEQGTNQDAHFANELLLTYGCKAIDFERDSAKRAKLWEARHHLAYAFKHGYPTKQMMLTDVCVPRSKLADAVEYAATLIAQSSLNGGVLGHVGDGNFHSIIMFNKKTKEEAQMAHSINDSIVQYALAHGGSCTGEHGIGMGKISFLEQEHHDTLHLMKMIKQQLDPKGILNPGKIFREGLKDSPTI